MTGMGTSLRAHTQYHWRDQFQAAVHTGVAQGTVSGILLKGHNTPQIETPLGLDNHPYTDRLEILGLASSHPHTAQPSSTTSSATATPPPASSSTSMILAAFSRSEWCWIEGSVASSAS